METRRTLTRVYRSSRELATEANERQHSETPGDRTIGHVGSGAVPEAAGASIAPCALSTDPPEAQAEDGTEWPPAATLAAMPSAPAPATPRAAMLAHLSADMGAALAADDLAAARVAHEAIGKLMALGLAPVDGAPVIDLATERRKRDK